MLKFIYLKNIIFGIILTQKLVVWAFFGFVTNIYLFVSVFEFSGNLFDSNLVFFFNRLSFKMCLPVVFYFILIVGENIILGINALNKFANPFAWHNAISTTQCAKKGYLYLSPPLWIANWHQISLLILTFMTESAFINSVCVNFSLKSGKKHLLIHLNKAHFLRYKSIEFALSMTIPDCFAFPTPTHLIDICNGKIPNLFFCCQQ